MISLNEGLCPVSESDFSLPLAVFGQSVLSKQWKGNKKSHGRTLSPCTQDLFLFFHFPTTPVLSPGSTFFDLQGSMNGSGPKYYFLSEAYFGFPNLMYMNSIDFSKPLPPISSFILLLKFCNIFLLVLSVTPSTSCKFCEQNDTHV